jgi:glycine cleavage system aminomethyltransferase T/glycine/D-amino acid oxidase-like deaminating enzyme
MTSVVLPSRARYVIVGGGIIGTSVAYHLARMGQTDVVLLERDRLTSGTTWHAAGLIVTFGSTSETSTELRKYTRDLYTRLEQETGQSTGFLPCGFIEVASDRDRLEEYRRVSAFNRLLGVDVHEISPGQVKELFPLARTDDLLAGFYVKEDGRVNPVDATMALAKGARMHGATLIEGVPVSGFLTDRPRTSSGPSGMTRARGRVTGVRTAYGDIEAEYVVNCAGMWARELAADVGVNIPLQAAEHYYLITERIKEISNTWPVLEDPASHGYFREEIGGLMIGLFEPVCAPWKVEGVPHDFSFGEIQPDWDRMGPYVEKAMARVPMSMNAGVKKFFCGPESFTPDLAPIVGEAPELDNFFVAAGLNSIGIITGGGIGRMMAHWLVNGRPDVDISYMDIKRLQPHQGSAEYRRTRTVESLGMVYQCHYPNRSMTTARGAKQSPFYDRLAARGAYFRDVSGWESADWYASAQVNEQAPGRAALPPGRAQVNAHAPASPGRAALPPGRAALPPGRAQVNELTFGKPSWFPQWAAEHQAAREGVILMDMSFMSKFLVEGRDAGRLLDWISANKVDGAAGQITYTQWLDAAGKLQGDLTVTKLDDQTFWVVASDTVHRHTLAWMKRQFGDAHAFAADMTSAYAQINIQGPRSRELMQLVTAADMGNAAFPFRAAREIDIGFARVLCIRITYLGELGYELYIPSEQATHVYDRLVAAGEQVGLVHAGLKTLASCRMEKAYRDYGHDIDNTDSVLEAGLGFAVDLEKPGGFLGKDAVVAEKARGPLTRRLLQILVKDPDAMMFHAEIVRRDGRPISYIRAASYGHTLGGAVGLAMVQADVPIDAAWIAAGTWEVDIAGRIYPAIASLRPLYDPTNKKVKL